MNAHTKTDQPPFRMRIENGHLVPATPYDAERLSTFRSSRELLVYPTQQPNRKLVQKWFAVIGKAVSECPTPWHSKDQASDAIKLALGHGTPIKTVGGNWVQVPKSLNELNDAELSDLFDRAMALLERITGVDPLTLGAEATSVDAPDDHHEEQNSDAPPPASDGEAKPDAADASNEGGEVTPPASPPSPDPKMIECCKKLLDIAKDETMTPQVRRGVLAEAKDDWKAHLPKGQHEQLKSIFQSADAVIRGDTSHESAVGFFAEALGCKPEDIGGAA
ncbi:hypothetical protein [Oceaniradius stylonematis]|uniref:hypothetical protein n=1 Tax=Oceaniradius stylonematis TaxID=2184161 RepID=UPI00273EEA82|nr:hypothetical protein [Oceaniradius stylonematis]